MERVLSQDERIRRAEELYARRRLQVESRTSATVNVDERNSNRLTRKIDNTIYNMFDNLCLILCNKKYSKSCTSRSNV